MPAQQNINNRTCKPSPRQLHPSQPNQPAALLIGKKLSSIVFCFSSLGSNLQLPCLAHIWPTAGAHVASRFFFAASTSRNQISSTLMKQSLASRHVCQAVCQGMIAIKGQAAPPIPGTPHHCQKSWSTPSSQNLAQGPAAHTWTNSKPTCPAKCHPRRLPFWYSFWAGTFGGITSLGSPPQKNKCQQKAKTCQAMCSHKYIVQLEHHPCKTASPPQASRFPA